jgi:hypothetical protein
MNWVTGQLGSSSRGRGGGSNSLHYRVQNGVWGPSKHLPDRGPYARGRIACSANLTTHPHVMSKLRIREATVPLARNV